MDFYLQVLDLCSHFWILPILKAQRGVACNAIVKFTLYLCSRPDYNVTDRMQRGSCNL